VRFAVLDVGQGLSQLLVVDSAAISFDMGPVEEFEGWLDGYRVAGSPCLEAIVLSHEHPDHIGGIARLPDSITFSGLIITTPHADTALIRRRAGGWGDRLVFRTACQGDTLAVFREVGIRCLWPPRHLDEPYEPNRHSLCFRMCHGRGSVLITSDIDTVAQRLIGSRYGWDLASSAIVVPHHGSRSALSPAFYAYVDPPAAIISCGRPNDHGHPHDQVLRLLYSFPRLVLYETALHGHIIGRSNGHYWSWDGNRGR
jgi:competence protein ComEC